MRLRLPKRSREWHAWFAWRPVLVDGYVVWLEPVARMRGEKTIDSPWGPIQEDGWIYRLDPSAERRKKAGA